MKGDNFVFLGGINQKASQADLSVLEFLDISNLDFTATGALSQRQGTTYLASGATNAALNITLQFTSLAYFGYSLVISLSNTIVSFGPSFVGPNITSIYEFTNLQGSSVIMFSAPGFLSSISFGTTFSIPSVTLSQMYYMTGSTFNYLLETSTKLVSVTTPPVNTNWSFRTFVNRVFFCNGDNFYKWDGNFGSLLLFQPSPASYDVDDGSNTGKYIEIISGRNSNAYKYGLPRGTSLYFLNNLFNGTSLTNLPGGATYTYSWGFINERGFRGPVSDPFTVSSVSLGAITIYGFSSGAGLGFAGFSGYDGYGIGTTTLFSGWQGLTIAVYSGIAIYRDNGPGTGRYLISGAQGSQGFLPFPKAIDTGFPLTTIPEPTCINATLPPQFLEIYNNQLFMCGFSQAPSTVQFSDIGEPESVQPNFNFDVRTNDGDYLTGMKAAFSRLFLFKNNSFHALNGTDPSNFALEPVSDQYGCISNRAVVTYENEMMFLDKKGIARYNGALITIASSKLDPIFANMNISAAQNNAWMIHDKDRNQIWCGIPVNGTTFATQINKIIVYDYLLNAWTHFDGLSLACATMAFGSLQKQTAYVGSYSGYIAYYGTSFSSDLGNAITMSCQTRFIADSGQSVEKMWRRLYMTTRSVNGVTSLWKIALYANYSSTASVTFTQGGISFQSRSDFGVSSKSLSVSFATNTSTDILQLTGFTIESRFQRST